MYRLWAQLLVCAALGCGQTFEVASVKASGPHSIRGSDGGPGSHDPSRFTYYSASLADLFFFAWPLRNEQQIVGPEWIRTLTYDVVATIPEGTSKAQFRIMLQNLMADRFKLKVHHETKDFPVYELVIGKNGPKLHASAAGATFVNKEGFPQLPAGKPGIAFSQFVTGRGRMNAHDEPIAKIAGMLESPAGRVIIDKTGLTGTYDVTLEYSWKEMTGPDDDPLPSIFTAVQQQLGLKLMDGKAPFDVVVVDSAEKVPTEN
ncbi:MAG TPA: TIGR03435 family protein [Bryobacteraceae bacterium]|jgi:uncharacterized protein (TIGR03435 family)